HALGHDWYDDSKATNPAAAMAALGEFARVIWICGGLTKGLDLSAMRDAVAAHVRYAYVIGHDARPFLSLLQAAGVQAEYVRTMEQAVAAAAQSPDELPVLLSPAAASQDQFRDYAERGRAFVNAVRKLERQA
ncbi:MAG: UDP-N-acetylmuramoyl-L-alanine--D-glutamate ligase, partial [Zetaproteobacteria bacterium]